MENYIISEIRLGKRVSMVIRLIDQYTALGSNESDINVFLNGRPSNFQRKAGGYLVFTELEEELYRVVIESKFYLSEEFEVRPGELDRAEPVVYVALKPSLLYRFNSSATLIRVTVCRQNGEPVKDADITATLLSDNCARAKLGRQGAVAGWAGISLVDVTGRLAPGDLFLIRPVQGEEGEICEMATMGVGESVYELKKPPLSDHARGELLMPVIMTRTNERGEAVLALRNFGQKECELSLRVAFSECDQIREIKIQSGITHNLGTIII